MSSNFNFHGVTSALPTPFLQGEVDYDSLKKMIEYQLKNEINGLVINGTTAESPTLTGEEVEKIYRLAREICGNRIHLILGTGTNSTKTTIEKTKKAEQLGADAALVVVPYYNKPPQQGLEAHFSAVAESTQLPIIMYNVPGRTITSMSAETTVMLAQKKNIIGIKEASGDMELDQKLKTLLPAKFALLSGDDPTFIDFMKIGGHGLISVMSNLMTKESVNWYKLGQEKKFAQAHEDFLRYKKIISLMYCEANPIPLKWMMFKMGLMKSPEMRLPLTTLNSKFHAEIVQEMTKLGLLS